jgi:hypothetical protein
MSSYTQELACYVGQQMVFEDGSNMLKSMKGLKLDAKQIERICHVYGQHLENHQESLVETNQAKEYPQAVENESNYVMVDGGMFLTREEGWKEVKLGRIFSSKNVVTISDNRGMITDSDYVAHLGTHKEFFSKFEYFVEELPNPVFISDGAQWIWNWVDDFYSEATQILDYFHAAEHLCGFAKDYFSCEKEKKKWVKKQKRLLLNNHVQKVIKNISKMETSANEKLFDTKRKLMNYYQKNSSRMMYKSFIDKGLLIGSGAIESAMKSVLQQRMKLSGQRWTKKGFQNLANLRVVYKSNQWEKVSELVQIAA